MNEFKCRIFPGFHFSHSLRLACLLLSFLLGGHVSQAVAGDIYIAQLAAGGDTGADAANAHSVAWLNTSSNWGVGAGQIGAGTTVHLVGTISNTFSILGSGLGGNPITIYFEANANMSAPVWLGSPSSTYCAIFGGCSHDIVIDGGANGIIQATQCGDALPIPTGCNGIVFFQANNVTIKNLTIQNLFVRHRWSTNEIGSGTAVSFALNNGAAPSSGIVLSNCILHDMQTGIGFSYVAGCSNFEVSACTIYNANFGASAGDANGSATLNGLLLRNNKFYNWANWDDAADNYHHNGFFGYGNNGYLTNVTVCGNTIGPGFGSDNTSGINFNSRVYGLNVYNNIFLGTDGTSPTHGFLTLGLTGGSLPLTVGIYNNTFVGAGQGEAIEVSEPGVTSPLPTFYITNNLVHSMGTAIAFYYYGGEALGIDYNAYYNVPLSTVIEASNGGNASYDPLATWRGYGFDRHSVTSNPNLDVNYSPNWPSAVGTNGAVLATCFTNDMKGVPRPANGWSIGAMQGLVPPANLRVVQ